MCVQLSIRSRLQLAQAEIEADRNRWVRRIHSSYEGASYTHEFIQ